MALLVDHLPPMDGRIGGAGAAIAMFRTVFARKHATA
jgi:hypothetical protein